MVKASLPLTRIRGGSFDGALDYLSGISPYDDRDKNPFPDLVILDLKLPGKDGFDVLAWVRSGTFALIFQSSF